MNRYISVIVVAAYVAVAARLMPAAEPEPIPSDAIKALFGRIDQIIADKGTTSAQEDSESGSGGGRFCTNNWANLLHSVTNIKMLFKMRMSLFIGKG